MSILNRLDPYRPGTSPLHYLDSRVKLVLSLFLILTINLIKPGLWIIFGICATVILVIVIFSRTDWKTLLLQSALAFPFILAALPLLFTTQGKPLFSTQLSGLPISVSYEGLFRFLSIFIKSWLSILVSILLVRTTQFSQILFALRWLRVPRILVVVIGLMWRYLFVLVGEGKRLINARDSRSSSTVGMKSGGNILWRSKISGGMAGSLFLRSIDRSERVFNAMLSRGFDGEVRLIEPNELGNTQKIILMIGLLFLIFILALSGLIRG